MALRSGMAKPEEFDSQVPAAAQVLVICAGGGGAGWGRWGGGGAAGLGLGVGVGREARPNLAGLWEARSLGEARQLRAVFHE